MSRRTEFKKDVWWDPPGIEPGTAIAFRVTFSHQFFEVVCGGLPDGVDVVDEPGHAQAVQLLVEKVDSKLS